MFYSNNGGLAPGFNPTHLQHFMQQSNLLNQHQVSAYCYNYFYLRMSKFLILKFIPIILFQQLADAGRKQLEQLMHQLQEQLQINLLQQTHLMQTNSSNSENSGKNGGKPSQAMQQLQIQQQQLISQLQLVQQRLLMVIFRSNHTHILHNELKRGKNSNFKCVFGWLHDYLKD